MVHPAAVLALALLLGHTVPTAAQNPRPPVIDMHVHAGEPRASMIARFDSLNVRYAFISDLPAGLRPWAGADTSRFRLGLIFPCDHGRAPNSGEVCFPKRVDFPDTTWLRAQLKAGHLHALGEIVAQYTGVLPTDPRLEPYWRLAEEFDIPVGIHMGPGPPGAAYDVNPEPFKARRFRMTAGDPLLLEAVLLRHKRLRLVVMHAGWPRLEAMLALLYAHPNVYVDVGVLQFEGVVPRAGYWRYLRGLVEAGFSQRILYGSDFAELQEEGITAIVMADFLTAGQKADMLCNNAARFLRLKAGICDP